MSPQSAQAACMGCLVNPFYHPFYGPIYNPWPPQNWDKTFLMGDSIQQPALPFTLPPPATLTEEEKQVLALLAEAWNKFNSLDKKHPSDNPEFLDSIHRAQQIVSLRVARRVNPEVWNVPKDQNELPMSEG